MNGYKRIRAVFPLLAGAALLLALTGARGDGKEGAAVKPPPRGAVVLFDGKDLSGWEKRGGGKPGWKVEDGYMEIVSGTGDIRTKKTFGPDFQLHVEFWLPLMPDKKGQARANSGIYLQGRYEIQVLDNYKNDTYANGSVGAMYGILTPDKEAQQKAIRPPEQWQSFDITFHAPRVDDSGKVTEKGRATVVLNGVTIIDDGKFDHNTPGELNKKLGEPGPILLQDHHNEKGKANVRYRNIWLKPLSGGSGEIEKK